MKDWLTSRKTIHMLWTQMLLLSVLLLVMFQTGFDPIKIKALLAIVWQPLLAIAGLGGAAIIGQGVADFGRPKPKELAVREARIEVERAKAKKADRERG